MGGCQGLETAEPILDGLAKQHGCGTMLPGRRPEAMLSDSNHDESKSLGSEFPARTFATTHWSVVLEAADTANAGANEALERLCTTYWYPLYAYVRRQGYSPQDAEDLIQSFLARVLDRNLFRLADPNRGRFRSFLLGVLKHFLSDERKKATAQKRGGGAMLIPLDSVLAERQYEQETATREMSAEMLFDRRWALTVLQRAADRQRAEYVTAGNETLYGSLKQFQGGEREGV